MVWQETVQTLFLGIVSGRKRGIFRHFAGMVTMDRARQDWVNEYAETGRPLAALARHMVTWAIGVASIVRYAIGQVDWCHYVADREPTFVTGLIHRTGDDAAEDYRMLSVDFSPRGKPGTGAIAQISSGRYVPPKWQEAISYHPLAELRCLARGDCVCRLASTLVWFDEAGRHQESLESERPIGERLLTQFYRSVTSLVRRSRDLEDACLALGRSSRAAEPRRGAADRTLELRYTSRRCPMRRMRTSRSTMANTTDSHRRDTFATRRISLSGPGTSRLSWQGLVRDERVFDEPRPSAALARSREAELL